MRIAATVPLLLCVGVLGLILEARPSHAQSPPAPVTITTDSVGYCDNLARRMPPAASDEVARLWHEGKTLCDQGHVRSGIMQLRRALLLARGDRNGSDR